MAFSDFTLESVRQVLGITTASANLFPAAAIVAVPPWLPEAIARGTPLALLSEKARSEFIVAPTLLACRELAAVPVSIYSGQRLDVDPARGLVGECDFILALAPPVPPLRVPLATVVEAKKNDIEAGLGQCVAQMVAADLFNRADGYESRPIYGCVTSGEAWQFLRLVRTTAQLHERRYYIDDLPAILGAFLALFSDPGDGPGALAAPLPSGN